MFRTGFWSDKSIWNFMVIPAILTNFHNYVLRLYAGAGFQLMWFHQELYKRKL